MRLLWTALAWLGLLGLLALEFASAYMPMLRAGTPAIGIAMAVIVALTFMRLGRSRGLVPIFAMAGVFWVLVMLGLGCLDLFTRHDVRVEPIVDRMSASR